jgi:PAS domain S-box-containing protein
LSLPSELDLHPDDGSESLVSTAFAVPGLLLILMDPAGSILDASGAWKGIYADTGAMAALVHASDLATFEQACETAVTQGSCDRCECRIRSRDGSYRTLRLSLALNQTSRNLVVHGVDVSVEGLDIQRVLPLVADIGLAFIYHYDLESQCLTWLGRDARTYAPADSVDHDSILHPDDHHILDDVAFKAESAWDGQTVESEYLVRKDDGVRWLWNRFTVFSRGANGKPTQVVGALHDVTSRKEQEDSYRHLFSSSPHPMWVFDIQSLRFLAVNETAIEHYGYSRSEFLTMSVTDIRPKEDVDRWFETVHNGALSSGELWRHVKKNGEVIIVRIWARAITYLGREARIVTILDETDKSTAIHRLMETSATMEAVLNQSPVAIFGLDSEARVKTWNPAASNIFGLDEASAVGTELRKLTPHRHVALDRLQTRLLAGESFEGQPVRVRRKDHTLLELTVSARSFHTSDGVYRGSVAVVEDSTAKNFAERELKALNRTLKLRVSERTAELEAANQELEAFCFSVAHDLRQPLRAIDGFSRAVMEDYESLLNPQGVEMLTRIRTATQRLGATMDSLLVLSRITRAPLAREWIDLGDIAHQTISDLRATEPERSVKVHIDEYMPAYGDPTLLALLVQNLLENAWKFTGHQPSPRIDFTTDMVEGVRIFSVRDNGAGFDMKYSNKLFQPFERLHTLAEFPGNGIGLATCQRVVARHGGQITLVGAVNEGASALFSLAAGPEPTSLSAYSARTKTQNRRNEERDSESE